MASLFSSAAAGAGLEIVFGSFLRAVLVEIRNNSIFLPTLEELQRTLDNIKPSVKRMESFNMDFDRPTELDGLKHLMAKGEQLIRRCSKVKRYNFLMKSHYTRKLVKLDRSINRCIGCELIVHQSANIQETLFGVNQLSNQIRQVSLSISSSNSGMFNRSGLAGVCSPPGLKVNPVGLEIPLRDLKRKLLKEDVKLVVLSAPGGCGKTTLATAFCQEKEVKDKFRNNIFFVTVSRQANLLVIVQRLYQHNGQLLPEFQSEEDAVNLLEYLFKEIGLDPILLVLDDVWSGSESVLEMLKFRIENYRILVTSRFEFPRFGSTYKLKTLNDADALALFRDAALLPDSNSYIPDKDEIDKVVKTCKGFPLAISVIGKSLCGQPAAGWRKTIEECSKASSVLSNFELLNRLQTSVDALGEKGVVKECYMDLGSFPEDQRIPAPTLTDMWVEMHNLKEVDAIINLYELSNRNFVDLVVTRKDASEEDLSCNEHFVTQHDLLRELAIRQSNSGCIEHRKRLFLEIDGNKIPGWWIGQNQPLINARLLSISTDGTFSSGWCTMQAPEVEVLILNFQTKNYTLPEFMVGMNELKVLVVTNYSALSAELSNFSIIGSLPNLKRLRLEKVSIPSFFLTSIRLQNLEKISLVMCNVGQAFSNPAIPISDALPNLVEINIDYCNDLEELPIGFCDLIFLKTVSITNCHKLSALPKEIGKLNLEVLRLNSCIDLSKLPDSIGSLRNLRILDISECPEIRELPEQFGELNNLRKLYMIECPSCELPKSVMKLVGLKEVIGDEETVGSWERFKHFLPYLKTTTYKDVNLNWLC